MTAPATRVGASEAATTVGRLPDGRWSALEIAFWVIPVACFFLLPNYRVLGSQVLITALFAVSLDLILGYAGIVSLGHAAFFGIGAYTAGLLAVHAVSRGQPRPTGTSGDRTPGRCTGKVRSPIGVDG